METSSENLEIKMIYEFIAASTSSKKVLIKTLHRSIELGMCSHVRQITYLSTFQTVFTMDGGISDRGKLRLKINRIS